MGTDCTLSIEPGVQILLKESGTEAAITQGYPKTEIRSGNYVDTLWYRVNPNMTSPIELSGAFNRAGKYSVSIELEGYEKWTKENVNVPQGECGAITQNITAFLKKK